MLKPTATQAKKLFPILDGQLPDLGDGEEPTIEQVAMAAMKLAWEMYEESAKFVVVGQVSYSPHSGGYLTPKDAASSKFAIGPYKTEKQATNDALSAAYSAATHEESRVWVLPLHSGTPSEFYKTRKPGLPAVRGDAPAPKRCFMPFVNDHQALALCSLHEAHDGLHDFTEEDEC